MRGWNSRGLFLGVIGLLLPAFLWAVPISDLAKDIFEQGPSVLNPEARSPFVPGSRIGEDVDVGTLLVQGIIYGKKNRMALISGRVVREGEEIGRYAVDRIEPDKVTLSHHSNIYQIKVEGYVPLTDKKAGSDYLVEFKNAGLKEALHFLAKGANANLITPEDIGGNVTLSFSDIELMEALRSILRVNGYEYAMESGVIRVGKPDAFSGGTDLKTRSFHLKYATAKDLVEKYKPLLSDKGSVIADDRTNTLTVKDRDPMVANISDLISQIDRRDQQVQIEARIVVARRNFSRDLGIRWGLSGQKDNIKIGGGAASGNTAFGTPFNVDLGAVSPTSGVGVLIGKLGGILNVDAQLSAAEEKGDAQVLSKPSVTTLNNMPAKIRSGTKIYVKAATPVNIGTATPGSGGLEEIDTGIELTVTPQISSDDFIKVKIDAVQSEPDFGKLTDGIPSIIDNTASTTVILRDGETTIIGGLFQEKDSTAKKRVPGFSSIPVMGHLFQSKSRLKSDSELIIFITPRIVKF